VSLALWKKDGKISVDSELNIHQQIKKYLKECPTLTRSVLRTLIRLEYENQSFKNTRQLDQRREEAFLKRLDRSLDKTFSSTIKNETLPSDQQKEKPSEIEETIIEQVDNRPEWCGVKASPKFCKEYGIPETVERKRTRIIKRKT